MAAFRTSVAARLDFGERIWRLRNNLYRAGLPIGFAEEDGLEGWNLRVLLSHQECQRLRQAKRDRRQQDARASVEGAALLCASQG
jgi:hypothetical protein